MALPLFNTRSRLAFFSLDGVQHHLVRITRAVRKIAFAPVVSDSVCEDGAGAIKRGSCNATADRGVTLQPVLGVFIPEVECAIASSSTKRPMLGVE